MQTGATYPALCVNAAPTLPVADLIFGKPIEEAAELLPRLFNLCRTAQKTAARAAFGLPLEQDWQAELRREILREHVAKLCLKWPALFSIPALPLPCDWIAGGDDIRFALFGASGRLPETYAEFRVFLDGGTGIAPVLCAIHQAFARGEACRSRLPTATLEGIFGTDAQENSVAGRQVDHPVLKGIEADMGRGPFWSAVAVACDIQMCFDGQMPQADLAVGRAVIPAARGLYGITARVEQGRVMAFHRVTPTDHLLAPGGAMEQSLAMIPADRAEAVAPLLMSILDPCYPVSLEPVQPREHAHA